MASKKRGAGEGCISQRKDGRWIAIVTLGKNPDGSQKRKILYGKSRGEVQVKLTTLLNEINLGNYHEPSKLLLGDWMQKWLWDFKKITLKPKTFTSYTDIVDMYINKYLGHIALGDLKTHHVQNMINEMDRMKLSPRTIKYAHTLLVAAIDKAVLIDLMVKNVAKACTLPKNRQDEVKVLSVTEQQTFLKAVSQHRLRAAFYTLLASGVRIGELLALKWSDIFFEDDWIYICRNIQRVKVFDEHQATKTKLVEGTTKTAKSTRKVPIIPQLREILIEHRRLQEIEKDAAGELYIDSDYLFCNEIGQPIDSRNFTRTFKRILKDNGLPDIKVHSLRHTFATRALENDIELIVVQELLGHSSIRVTADTYSHVLPYKMKGSMVNMEKVFDTKLLDEEKQ